MWRPMVERVAQYVKTEAGNFATVRPRRRLPASIGSPNRPNKTKRESLCRRTSGQWLRGSSPPCRTVRRIGAFEAAGAGRPAIARDPLFAGRREKVCASAALAMGPAESHGAVPAPDGRPRDRGPQSIRPGPARQRPAGAWQRRHRDRTAKRHHPYRRAAGAGLQRDPRSPRIRRRGLRANDGDLPARQVRRPSALGHRRRRKGCAGLRAAPSRTALSGGSGGPCRGLDELSGAARPPALGRGGRADRLRHRRHDRAGPALASEGAAHLRRDGHDAARPSMGSAASRPGGAFRRQDQGRVSGRTAHRGPGEAPPGARRRLAGVHPWLLSERRRPVVHAARLGPAHRAGSAGAGVWNLQHLRRHRRGRRSRAALRIDRPTGGTARRPPPARRRSGSSATRSRSSRCSSTWS